MLRGTPITELSRKLDENLRGQQAIVSRFVIDLLGVIFGMVRVYG